MKRLFLFFPFFFLFFSYTFSQQPADVKDEIKNNVCLSASNSLAYSSPTDAVLTDAPKGYEPFYISHYGRHGSRFLLGSDDYEVPIRVLAMADSLGRLSALGQSVLQRITLLYEDAKDRYGELTPLGAQQHKEIAQRMFYRFPEVFAGDAFVDAKSTVVIRCILSMENALQQLLTLNPKLNITHDASYHDMYYMNMSDPALQNNRMPRKAQVVYDEYKDKHFSYQRLINLLFNDSLYVKYEVDSKLLAENLYALAGIVQNTELRDSLTLYDIFTEEELYGYWLTQNAWWYINFAACKLNGGMQPYTQRNLLRNIISEADNIISDGDKHGATLRFGHESIVMPLTCLLGINDYDLQTDDLDSLEDHGWVNYNIFPMAANIQIVFYKNKKSTDKDFLLKVLLNEHEVTLPIHSELAPYYKWRDFKQHYNAKLDTYETNMRELQKHFPMLSVVKGK